MLVEFSVWPADQPHMSKDIDRIRDILTERGLEFQVGPMGTSIEGSWDEIMDAIRACHLAVAESHERILTSINIDDHDQRDELFRMSASVAQAVTA